jgi:hypothetical protein
MVNERKSAIKAVISEQAQGVDTLEPKGNGNWSGV